MKKIKKYKYQGVNGSIISSVFLEGIDKIELYDLTADDGKILTNGIMTIKHALVLTSDVSNWKEIDNSGQE